MHQSIKKSFDYNSISGSTAPNHPIPASVTFPSIVAIHRTRRTTALNSHSFAPIPQKTKPTINEICTLFCSIAHLVLGRFPVVLKGSMPGIRIAFDSPSPGWIPSTKKQRLLTNAVMVNNRKQKIRNESRKKILLLLAIYSPISVQYSSRAKLREL